MDTDEHRCQDGDVADVPGTRVERDTMGEMRVPAEAQYGAQTARAVANFPISGRGIGRAMIRALGLIKGAASEVNRELGLLDERRAGAIAAAAEEVADGTLDAHFPVDVFQTGSGTSSNMNANEVIANRANVALGSKLGANEPVHPNDHVNLGQSSNDVFPAAIHLAAECELSERLAPALERLRDELLEKSRRFDDVVKIGRTHLQDATPIRLGQEFSGYAAQIDAGLERLAAAREHLRELALGGTAVGTGAGAHPEFGRRVAEKLAARTRLPFREARNHFAAQAAQDAAVQQSGTLRTVAISLIKIADDIRWLGSGPRVGLGELRLPAVQPGSSMMPGKVNPVIAEALLMACVQVVGNDAAIALAAQYGRFELHTMLPLVARNLLEQIALLAAATDNFTRKLLAGLEVDRERIAARNEQSLALATGLVPLIGYERAAALVREAWETGRTVREVAVARHVASPEEIGRALDPRGQTEPGR
ncbi:MAG: class II fumarate hydratase [Deltaproteobacteria bacterium]|nr:class II fumarate hydratase [Deltaproteobacteria bacterium]